MKATYNEVVTIRKTEERWIVKKMLLVPALLGVVGVSATVGSTNADAAYTLEQIKNLALTEVNGTITDIEYENKGTRSYYEVEVSTTDAQYELKYDATTGALLKKEIESYDEDDYDDDDYYEYKSYKNNNYLTNTNVTTLPTDTQQPTFTADQIQQKALDTVTGGTVTELEYKRGYYEVDVVTTNAKYDLTFDATTGELINNTSKQYSSQFTNNATVQAKLTVAEIQQKALAIVSGTVTEVEYEKGYYEVDVVDGTTKYELKLNATTGELIAKKQETKNYKKYKG